MCARKKNKQKSKLNKIVEVWSEAEYEQYLCDLYGLEYIVDFTPAGLPIGLPCEEEQSYIDEEIPF